MVCVPAPRSLITLELGPETELERIQKLVNEIGQERLTRLDRALLARAKDGILVVTSAVSADPTQHTLRIGRLKTLERLGLAEERQAGVWALDPRTETKLRQLGERADKFKMMQRALKQAGIERATSAWRCSIGGPRKIPLIGKLVGVGLVDEITDRTWIVIDAVDGRVHYAELGRLGDTVTAWSRSACCSRRSELAGSPVIDTELGRAISRQSRTTDRLRRADLARSGHTLEVATRYPSAGLCS